MFDYKLDKKKNLMIGCYSFLAEYMKKYFFQIKKNFNFLLYND